MEFATINGVTIAYRVAGRPDAPALVLVNSLGTDARIWDRVIDRLSGRYRVVSYDKRGHGLSDSPPGPYSLDDHVADLLGVAERAGLGTFALAGVSVGGLIAQGLAVRSPGRLSALILCDTAARLGSIDSWNNRIATVAANGMVGIADAILELWFTDNFRQNCSAELHGWRTMFLANNTEGYMATCATLRDTDLTSQVGTITTPTLVVCGANDRSSPPDLVRATAAMIPNSRFELIDNAGHIPSIEQPGRLAANMERFLTEVGHG